jgi:hypothetical protein
MRQEDSVPAAKLHMPSHTPTAPYTVRMALVDPEPEGEVTG